MARAADAGDPDELEQIAEPRYHQRTVVGILKDMQLRIHCICHKISGTATNEVTTSVGDDRSHRHEDQSDFFRTPSPLEDVLRPACTPSVQKESPADPSEFRRPPEPAVPAP